MSTTPPSLLIQPPPFVAEASFPVLLTSRWRRSIAFLIDGMLLGIAANILCIPFFEGLIELGIWGRVFGFLVGLAYFACFESGIGHGRTPGKRLLGIKLVDREGQALPLGEAALRSAVFSAPFFLNNLPLSVSRTPGLVATGISVLVLVLVGTNYYLLLLNGRTRQGLHDLSVGSYVVNEGQVGAVEVGPIWPKHWIILGSVVSLGGLLLTIAMHKLETVGPFPRLLQDVARLEMIPGVERAGVQDLHAAQGQENSTNRIAVVTLYWKGRADQEEEVSNQAASILLRADPEIARSDYLRIVVIRGFDIGIASRWVAQSFEHTPEIWAGYRTK